MADLLDLLEKTSRTFALSIPPLPEPVRREVTVAYLLFRIADTFEDATHWPPAQRIAALEDFGFLLKEGTRAEAERLGQAWAQAGASRHAGYRELIAETPFVFEAFAALRPEAIEILRDHVVRSSEGMARFVARTDEHGLTLDSLEDLKNYCYTVAGIVGELLTELFLLEEISLRAAAPDLRMRARTFGEALQLVNILKDSAEDAAEGRRYLPSGVPRADVFALARRDLGVAGEYIETLHCASAPPGILEFTALPVALAWAALAKVEERGPGAKVGRPEVFRIARGVRGSIARGERPALYDRTLSGEPR
ncbi:MAG TPA: squalene/phytoene synthase family protein [Thermoanaerobaculia bacterium]|nr:squalene/phytoene synthase family protein [Thermoanaerobaculia bacterium]